MFTFFKCLNKHGFVLDNFGRKTTQVLIMKVKLTFLFSSVDGAARIVKLLYQSNIEFSYMWWTSCFCVSCVISCLCWVCLKIHIVCKKLSAFHSTVVTALLRNWFPIRFINFRGTYFLCNIDRFLIKHVPVFFFLRYNLISFTTQTHTPSIIMITLTAALSLSI